MVEMIANRQIQGDGYRASAGERFFCKREVAESLAARGIADYYYAPLPPYVPPATYEPTYETKVITPTITIPVASASEVNRSASQPFRAHRGRR